MSKFNNKAVPASKTHNFAVFERVVDEGDLRLLAAGEQALTEHLEMVVLADNAAVHLVLVVGIPRLDRVICGKV